MNTSKIVGDFDFHCNWTITDIVSNKGALSIEIYSQIWNVASLPTLLSTILKEQDLKLDGVNTPYLYFGSWQTTFGWHVEDVDLYSINYLHYGMPKHWYVIPPAFARKFEMIARGEFEIYWLGFWDACKGFRGIKILRCLWWGVGGTRGIWGYSRVYAWVFRVAVITLYQIKKRDCKYSMELDFINLFINLFLKIASLHSLLRWQHYRRYYWSTRYTNG